MPELPPPKRQPPPVADEPVAARKPVASRRYAELHCRTNFSFLEGASHPDELVQAAAALGYTALAITDRNSLAGVVRAHAAAKPVGLKLLIGAHVTPVDAPPVVLLATDRQAYGRLARLLTIGRRSAPKGECRLTFEDISQHAEGLLACVVLREALEHEPGAATGERSDSERVFLLTPHHSPLTTHHSLPPSRGKGRGWGGERDCGLRIADCVLNGNGIQNPKSAIQNYSDVFADRCYALAELHLGPQDDLLRARMCEIAREARVPLVAANDVHYHVPERRFLQDVLTATRHGCTVAELGPRLFPNAERYLKSPEQMVALFHHCPEAIARTVEIADRCRFSLDELRYEYPEELCPAGMTPLEHLTRLTWAGACERYPEGLPEKVRGLIEHELVLIEELHYEAYFLTVWDLVRFARSREILCQGRGSAANSAVCFCLGVTSVDPGRIDVLFERFVSKERNEAPDIDVDFEHERREEVIQYVYEKYGRDRAGMTAEVITYRPRSAVRDIGKALGLSLDRVDALAKSFEHYSDEEKYARRFREAGFNPTSRTAKQLASLVREIAGFPRHLSQHVGGLVITRGPLCELVPIENASMPDRTVIEWDKDDLDALGVLKVDCLALGMLTAIRRCFGLVEQHWGRSVTLATVPPEDETVYKMICRADTMGVFQIESRAQMAMLPRLRPREYYDLVIEVAIVRPGPIQGDMVHPYLRRRMGQEPVEYPDERIREVLSKTMGVPLFQEQAMRLAVVAAGFTPGEADQLRRAMGAWRRSGVIDQFQKKLMDGMQQNGYSADFAERLFKQIRGFGEYGFPESHAASFALLVYVSSWLKCYYPAAFTAALLNSQPMGFYAPAQLVADARKHGVKVLPADVNFSDWDCTLEGPDRALRLGLRQISGLSQTAAERIVEARGEQRQTWHAPPSPTLPPRGGKGEKVSGCRVALSCVDTTPYRSLDDFAHRTGLSQSVLVRLARADAFGSLSENRRTALWQSLPEPPRQLTLFAEVESDEPQVALSPLSPLEEVVADYRTTGLSLRDHPLKFIRAQLKQLKIVTARDLASLADGRRVRVAGLVLLRQRPGTASGITFVTLEDETGLANLIIHPTVWERFHLVARRSKGMIAWGTLQHRDEVMHVLVDKLQDLSTQIGDLKTTSRDFR